MTFDEELQRTLDTFSAQLQEEVSGRVKAEVSRQVRAVSDELAEARTEAAEAARAADAARTELEAARAAEAARLAEAALAAETARTEAVAAERDVATRRLAEAVGAIAMARSLSEVLDTLVARAGDEAARVAVLLIRGDGFQGWRFHGFGPAFDDGHSIDVPDADAGVIADVARTATVASAAASAGGDAPRFAELPSGRECVAVPLALAGEVVAVLYADAGAEQGSGTLNREPVEVLARYAARSLEALTAIKAARSLTLPAAAPSQPSASAAGDDSGDEYAAARRYARLLVSEIKLYHEPQVVAGRRDRDLVTRLGGEIARARVLYEQRVPASVRQNTDYVREELIRTLADGDASLLEVKG